MIQPITTPPTKPAAGLHQLPSRTRAVVHHVHNQEPGMDRLMAMGLCVGREIEILRQGNPLILRLLDARVGVSERLARQVVVEPRA